MTLFLLQVLCLWAHGQSANVTIALSPAGSFVAKTADVKGFATQKGNVVSAANIVVNLKSLKTGIELRDKHTLDHLEVGKYPEAVLVSASGQDGKGTGLILIRGIQKPISGTFKIKGTNLEADFAIKLSDFKIAGIRYMGVGVKDEAKIHVVVPLKKS